ncbi:hypothetical protein JCM2811A_31400 [Methylorubrum rhodinum]
MAGRELRVALADGEILRRLDEAAGALGVLFEIHSRVLPPDRMFSPAFAARKVRCVAPRDRPRRSADAVEAVGEAELGVAFS